MHNYWVWDLFLTNLSHLISQGVIANSTNWVKEEPYYDQVVTV